MYAFIKRALDLVLAIIGMAIALPVFPIIALLIKLDSRGGNFLFVRSNRER